MTPKSDRGAVRSELADMWLPRTSREHHQAVAWISSICLAYLVIGVAGLKPPAAAVQTLEPLEMPILTPFEMPESQRQDEEQKEEQADASEQAIASPVVPAVPESPEPKFPVPTVPDVVIPKGRVTPPLDWMRNRSQPVSDRIIPVPVDSGNFPDPDYPLHLREARMTGTIVLRISVDAAGKITAIDIKQSTGHGPLDTHTINHVRRRFRFPAADGPRVYESSLGYKLR